MTTPNLRPSSSSSLDGALSVRLSSCEKCANLFWLGLGLVLSRSSQNKLAHFTRARSAWPPPSLSSATAAERGTASQAPHSPPSTIARISFRKYRSSGAVGAALTTLADSALRLSPSSFHRTPRLGPLGATPPAVKLLKARAVVRGSRGRGPSHKILLLGWLPTPHCMSTR